MSKNMRACGCATLLMSLRPFMAMWTEIATFTRGTLLHWKTMSALR